MKWTLFGTKKNIENYVTDYMSQRKIFGSSSLVETSQASVSNFISKLLTRIENGFVHHVLPPYFSISILWTQIIPLEQELPQCADVYSKNIQFKWKHIDHFTFKSKISSHDNRKLPPSLINHHNMPWCQVNNWKFYENKFMFSFFLNNV